MESLVANAVTIILYYVSVKIMEYLPYPVKVSGFSLQSATLCLSDYVARLF